MKTQVVSLGLMCALLLLPAAAGLAGSEETGGERAIMLEHDGGEFLPGAEERVTLFPGHPELERRYSEASFIQMAYAALEDAIERSGYVVSFSLEGFRTVYRRDFDKVLVRELVTLDSPLRLEVRQTEVDAADGSTVGYAFTPRWVERFTIEDQEEMQAFMDHYQAFTLGDGLRHPDADESHRRMIAVTSYQVTVRFDGQSRTYKAAFKWIPGPPGEVTFIAEDHVTDGVDRALVQDGEIAPLRTLLGRSREVLVEDEER